MKIFFENKQLLFVCGFMVLIVLVLLEILDELKHSNMHTGVLQAAIVADFKEKIRKESQIEYGRTNGNTGGNAVEKLQPDDGEEGNLGSQNGTGANETSS